MKTIKLIASVAALCIVFAPCLLTFNEQPENEPQNWMVNFAGIAYTYGLYMAVRILKNKWTWKI
ncbi:MAG: hypothetical protein LBL18_00435 [Bacteroidales bacterium]|jgi:hypothetical protein|nr:hypothetical protein [Bacteroidales bacterium]